MIGPGDRPGRPGRDRARRVAIVAAGFALVVATAILSRDLIAVSAAARDVRGAVAARRFAEAEAPLSRWLRARPRSAEARYFEAIVAFATGRSKESADALELARQGGYPAPAIERLDGLLLARAGRPAEAEPFLRRALERSDAPDPESAEALAKIYLEAYAFGPAARALDRWTRDAPGDARPYLWRAEIDARTVADRGAQVNDYREALRRDPTLDSARLRLADVLREANRPEEASTECDAYLARKPDDSLGHLAAGLTALDLGDSDAAARHLDRALAIDPTSAPALSARAMVAISRADFAAALPLLDRAVKANPYDVEIRYRRGLCLARLGRADEARAENAEAARFREDDRRLNEIQQALVQRPGDVDLQVQVARWMFEHGHDVEGIRWAKKILAEHPKDASTNRLMAEYYDRRGDHPLANYYRFQADEPAPR